jgi:hypothetical protein
MNEIAGLIREMASILCEVYSNHENGTFEQRRQLDRLKDVAKRADALLPERPHGPAISLDRSQEEWNALIGHRKPKLAAD